MVERTAVEAGQAEGPGGTAGERGLFAPYRLVLDFSALPMTDDQFLRFCADNEYIKLELSAQRELVIMPPGNPESGSQNSGLTALVYNWSKQDGRGVSFDSSSLFRLPNGAVRAPDASWMARDRWEAVPRSERRRIPDVVPEFVMELRSPSDTLPDLQRKMAEYMDNGVRLGWLIDPDNKAVYVYRPGAAPQVLDNPATVSGEAVLPGFDLNLQEIW